MLVSQAFVSLAEFASFYLIFQLIFLFRFNASVRGLPDLIRDEAPAAFSSIVLPHYFTFDQCFFEPRQLYCSFFAPPFSSFPSISYCSLNVVSASVNCL